MESQIGGFDHPEATKTGHEPSPKVVANVGVEQVNSSPLPQPLPDHHQQNRHNANKMNPSVQHDSEQSSWYRSNKYVESIARTRKRVTELKFGRQLNDSGSNGSGSNRLHQSEALVAAPSASLPSSTAISESDTDHNNHSMDDKPRQQEQVLMPLPQRPQNPVHILGAGGGDDDHKVTTTTTTTTMITRLTAATSTTTLTTAEGSTHLGSALTDESNSSNSFSGVVVVADGERGGDDTDKNDYDDNDGDGEDNFSSDDLRIVNRQHRDHHNEKCEEEEEKYQEQKLHENNSLDTTKRKQPDASKVDATNSDLTVDDRQVDTYVSLKGDDECSKKSSRRQRRTKFESNPDSSWSNNGNIEAMEQPPTRQSSVSSSSQHSRRESYMRGSVHERPFDHLQDSSSTLPNNTQKCSRCRCCDHNQPKGVSSSSNRESDDSLNIFENTGTVGDKQKGSKDSMSSSRLGRSFDSHWNNHLHFNNLEEMQLFETGGENNIRPIGENDHDRVEAKDPPPDVGANMEEIYERFKSEDEDDTSYHLDDIESMRYEYQVRQQTRRKVTTRFHRQDSTEMNQSIIASRPETLSGLATKHIGPLRRFASAFPKLYYFLVQLVLPLLLLITLCFLFGWAIAAIESKVEIEANNRAIARVFLQHSETVEEMLEMRETFVNSTQACHIHPPGGPGPGGPGSGSSSGSDGGGVNNGTFSVDLGPNSTIAQAPVDLRLPPDGDDVHDQRMSCIVDRAADKFPIEDIKSYLRSSPLKLTFEWITCARAQSNASGTHILDDHRLQYARFVNDFVAAFQSQTKSTPTPKSNITAILELGDGSATCRPHVAGGALFWFTLMTTIGYGNTTPQTPEGRLLVYTFGFVSILGFLALNASAAKTLKLIVGDFLYRKGWERVGKGPLACLFWLSLLIGWISIVAVAIRSYMNHRGGPDHISFSDAYWLMFITTTTVGFGDYHIKHEEFRIVDMFYIPLMILFGFPILGNFAENLAETYFMYFPMDTTLEAIIAANREKLDRILCPTHEISKPRAGTVKRKTSMDVAAKGKRLERSDNHEDSKKTINPMLDETCSSN